MSSILESKITTTCSNCERAYRVKRLWLGKRIKCKSCSTSFVIKLSESLEEIEKIITEQQGLLVQQYQQLQDQEKELQKVKGLSLIHI